MPTVLELLAQRIISNVRELEGALNPVIAYANLFGREITLDVTQEVLMTFCARIAGASRSKRSSVQWRSIGRIALLAWPPHLACVPSHARARWRCISLNS